MRSLMWKLRIATLWVFYAVGMILLFLLVLMEPGFIDGLRNGRILEMAVDSPATLEMAAFVLVPLVLAFLTFVLTDTVVRWVNVVAGAFFGAMMVWDVFEHWGAAVVAAPVVSELVALSGLLVVVMALMKPKDEFAEVERKDADAHHRGHTLAA
ncbi:DUF6326 family protein [Sinomonas atrocyanea]|uniref:DUF6326 family protein n=1 Tax=Sinomonas atrocyanea TaxID=37927 RepID=UPI003D99CC7E